MKEKFSLVIETLHLDDVGDNDNVSHILILFFFFPFFFAYFFLQQKSVFVTQK